MSILENPHEERLELYCLRHIHFNMFNISCSRGKPKTLGMDFELTALKKNKFFLLNICIYKSTIFHVNIVFVVMKTYEVIQNENCPLNQRDDWKRFTVFKTTLILLNIHFYVFMFDSY